MLVNIKIKKICECNKNELSGLDTLSLNDYETRDKNDPLAHCDTHRLC